MKCYNNANLAIAAICLLALSLPCTLAFWRLPCAKPISVQRADPIVNNGTVAAHVHTIMGASGFHARASPDSITKSNCSSCIVQEDNSNYWIATLFYQHPNGTVEAVPQSGGMLVYYLQRPGYNGEKLHAFPPGLRMLAGNASKRTSDSTLESQAISYACINYAHASPETGAFPQKSCPQGLRVQVFFPSCWDGVNLDSADHKSHMAYPSGMNTGICPSSHPVHLISIFYEVIYQADNFAQGWLDANGKPFRAMPFFWSTGDNTGFGHHGDFMNGWNVDVLQKAVDDCTDMSGIVEYCQHFTFRTDEAANLCRPEYLPAVQETVTGQMTKIPNFLTAFPVASFDPCGVSPSQAFDDTPAGQPLGTCNGTFTNRSAYTSPTATMNMALAAAAPLTHTPNPIDQTGYIGCYTDGTPNRTLSDQLGVNHTPVSCRQLATSLNKGYVIFGIQYGGECWASKLANSYSAQGVSSHCTMSCNADSTGWTICGGPNANQVYYVTLPSATKTAKA